MSYIRNYMIIAFGLYGLSAIGYFLRVNLLWTPWQILKTTNLFIMHYVERLHAHTKRTLYNRPRITSYTSDIEEITSKMDNYGLLRDKIYCVISSVIYNIRNIFGISRHNKRNYLAIILTILFTKRALVAKVVVFLYKKKAYYKMQTILHKAYVTFRKLNPHKVKRLVVGMVGLIAILAMIEVAFKLWQRYMSKGKVSQKAQEEELHNEAAKSLDKLQDKLGDSILSIVTQIRAVDKLLRECMLKGYAEVARQAAKELNDCEDVLIQMKDEISKLEEVKAIGINAVYPMKYNVHLLILMDLIKAADDEKVLKMYQENIASTKTKWDKDSIDEGRDILYTYLKKCIEYYDELDLYLAERSKDKNDKDEKRGKKKIYNRERLLLVGSTSEVMEDYFE